MLEDLIAGHKAGSQSTVLLRRILWGSPSADKLYKTRGTVEGLEKYLLDQSCDIFTTSDLCRSSTHAACSGQSVPPCVCHFFNCSQILGRFASTVLPKERQNIRNHRAASSGCRPYQDTRGSERGAILKRNSNPKGGGGGGRTQNEWHEREDSRVTLLRKTCPLDEKALVSQDHG